MGPVEPDQINGLGFMLSDKKPGKFQMQVEWVRVLRADKLPHSRVWNRRRHYHLDLAAFPEAHLHHGSDGSMVRRHPRIPEFIEHFGVVQVRDVDESLQEHRPVALEHFQRRVDLG
jgi:hypothetical protein